MELIQRPIVEEVPLLGPVSITVREFVVPAFRYPLHRHPEAELTWVIKGSGLRYVGDSVEPFRAGDCCLLGGNLPHAWISSPGLRGQVRSLVIQFDESRFRAVLEYFPEFASLTQLMDRAARGLRFDPQLGTQLRGKFLRPASPLLRLAALLETLDELNRQAAATLCLAPAAVPKGLSSDARLGRVLQQVGERWNEPLSQAQCARIAGLSPAAFSRFFHRAMGQTFQSYLTDLRVSRACRELMETRRTVSEIAYATGFGNLSNFNRTFRLRRGMAPSEFRQRSLGAPSSSDHRKTEQLDRSQ